MIHIGLIGTGYMAAAHLKAYRHLPAARIVALANPSGRGLDGDFSAAAGAAAKETPLRLDMSQVKAYRDVAGLLADPGVEVVDICTPTRSHLELATAALAAGRHVLIEKPLARTAAEAGRIADAADQAAAHGVFLMPAMCIRFWPEYAWVKRAIEAGTYGPVRDARFRRVAQAPAWGRTHFLDGAASGGALFDLHIHDVDFIQHCFGRPRSVFAAGYSKVSGAVDHVVALYDVPGDAVVSAEGSWCMAEGFGFSMSFTVNFERATADYDLARGADALRLYEPGRPPVTVRAEGDDGYTGELRYFLDCVAARRPPARVTARDGAAAVALCEAEEASVRTRRPVAL